MLQSVSKGDMLFVLADVNVKDRNSNKDSSDDMGTHGVGVRNKSCKAIVDLSIENDLVIEGTRFRRETCLKTAWVSF